MHRFFGRSVLNVQATPKHRSQQIAAFLRYAKCQKEKEIYNNMQKIKRNNKVQNTLVLIS